MKLQSSIHLFFLLLCLLTGVGAARAQFLVDMIDTNAREDKGLWAIYKKADHLLISGYFQPQFQVAQQEGAANYSGGDFGEYSNSRIMMRRARIKFDYAHFTKDGLPQAQVVFQFDGTERGVVIRDFWGRFYESKWQLFSFTTGMFARPFGYEVNLSSSVRETPERGRMSQILMKSERDLGLMATLEPRKKSNKLRLIKVDLGVFNGQGLTATAENDSYKDIIGRVSLKPYPLSRKVSLSAGASFFEGGMRQHSKYIYRNGKNGSYAVDSSIVNIGGKAPRQYRGLDAQLKVRNPWGATELRAEYWWGTQTAGRLESNTPGEMLLEPYFIREFDGAFFYLIQDIMSEKHQVLLKYDFYDPNRHVGGRLIGVEGNYTNPGDIRYNTLGVGYLYNFNQHIKLLAWYDMIRNETTSLEGYETDLRDNVLTCRVQFTF